MRIRTALLAVSALVAATPAFAVNITGSLAFGGGTTNYFDRAKGFVPAAGFGNSTGGTTVAVGPGVEFGFRDSYNADAADFTATSLTINDLVLSGGTNNSAVYTFTSDTADFFNGATLGLNTLGGSFSVTGNTLAYRYAGGAVTTGSTLSALITFAGATPAVPEPATWAMMLVGFGAMGVAMRRRAKVSAVRFA